MVPQGSSVKFTHIKEIAELGIRFEVTGDEN